MKIRNPEDLNLHPEAAAVVFNPDGEVQVVIGPESSQETRARVLLTATLFSTAGQEIRRRAEVETEQLLKRFEQERSASVAWTKNIWSA